MLDKTGMTNEPEKSPARIFLDLIKEVLVLNMTCTDKSSAWITFNRFYPGISDVVKNASRPCEDQPYDCFHGQEVTQVLGIPDDEVSEIMLKGEPWDRELDEVSMAVATG